MWCHVHHYLWVPSPVCVVLEGECPDNGMAVTNVVQQQFERMECVHLFAFQSVHNQ